MNMLKMLPNLSDESGAKAELSTVIIHTWAATPNAKCNLEFYS